MSIRGDTRNGVSNVTYHDPLKVVGMREHADVNVRHPESISIEVPTYNDR
jgi:hypothetical protein